MSQKFISTMAIIVVISLCLSGAAWAAQSAKVDVTGAWTFTVQVDAGTGNPMVTFKQDGEKLTGRYASALFGEAELTGSVKGQAIEFTVHGVVQGFKVEMKFDGTVESKDSLKGKLSTGVGGGTFTAKRN